MAEWLAPPPLIDMKDGDTGVGPGTGQSSRGVELCEETVQGLGLGSLVEVSSLCAF